MVFCRKMPEILFFFQFSLVLVCLMFMYGVALPSSETTSASRLPGSPYPVSSIPTVATAILYDTFLFTEQVSLLTLAGQVARKQPQLYFLLSSRPSYERWLQEVQLCCNLTVDWSLYPNATYQAIVSRFIEYVSGYALYSDTSDIIAAIDVCAAHPGVIAASKAEASILEQLNISMTWNTTGKSQEWAFQAFSTKYSRQIVISQSPAALNYLSDYSVFAGAFSLYETYIGPFTGVVLSTQQPNSALFGWGVSEDGLVELASALGIFVHASDWAENLSFLSNTQVPEKLQQKPEPIISNKKENVHTVAFLLTDGDNIQWLLNDFAFSEAWFGSPRRGETHLGWTISPAMTELAPAVLQAIYNNCSRTMNGSDTIVAAPSGLGYFYPDASRNATSFAELTNSFLEKANMTGIVNVIGNSAKNREEVLAPFLQQPNIEAVFYYLYSSYVGLQGEISFMNNKPIIGGRWELWPGVSENVTSLITKINAAPRNISSVDSYSLIPVQVWSSNVSMVLDVVNGLDAEGIQVVTPKQLVSLIRKNIAVQNH